jgi:hypothetical protein
MNRQEVLQSVQGNQDRAIDTLLGMSDPEYKSQHPPVPPPVRFVKLIFTYTKFLFQAESDEEYARRLYLEDQQAQQQRWPQQPPAQSESTPYEPRRGWQQGQQSGGQAGSQKDTVAEFQEQVLKIAESAFFYFLCYWLENDMIDSW